MNDGELTPKAVRDLLVAADAGARALLAPLLSTAETLKAHGPAISEWLAVMSRVPEVLRYWDQHAPTVLKDALGDAGLIVPVSQMSLPDMIELLGACRDRGRDAAVAWVREEYDRIFVEPGFLARLESTWAGHPLLGRRMGVLRDALRTHEHGFYGASVPTFIAQFEGLVADLVEHHGQMNGTKLKEHVAKLAAKEPWTDDVVQSFISDTLLAKFAHGSATPAFSRHAILHGGDVAYGTQTNSQTAILLIDYLREVGIVNGGDTARASASTPHHE